MTATIHHLPLPAARDRGAPAMAALAASGVPPVPAALAAAWTAEGRPASPACAGPLAAQVAAAMAALQAHTAAACAQQLPAPS